MARGWSSWCAVLTNNWLGAILCAYGMLLECQVEGGGWTVGRLGRTLVGLEATGRIDAYLGRVGGYSGNTILGCCSILIVRHLCLLFGGHEGARGKAMQAIYK